MQYITGVRNLSESRIIVAAYSFQALLKWSSGFSLVKILSPSVLGFQRLARKFWWPVRSCLISCPFKPEIDSMPWQIELTSASMSFSLRMYQSALRIAVQSPGKEKFAVQNRTFIQFMSKCHNLRICFIDIFNCGIHFQ